MLQENKDSFATREVQIFPYDPQWKVEFEKIKGMITRYAGEYFSAIEHVGSTSVEGLGAKPIIDLDAVLRCPNDLPKVIEAPVPTRICPSRRPGTAGQRGILPSAGL